jgi:type II secretory pathway pseudopilin PulG
MKQAWKTPGKRIRRRSFTLLEILIAFSVIATIAGVLVHGIVKSVRVTQLQTAKQRIEQMLLHAYRFATVSGHVGDVIVEKTEEGEWEGHLNLWEIDARGLSILAKKCSPIGHLSSINSLSINDRSVHSATFRFFGGHGLSAVYARDENEREMSVADFQFEPCTMTHREQQLTISVRSATQAGPVESISCEPFLRSVPRYRPFPDEILQTVTAPQP